MKLEGKTAIVTGGAAGIGRAITLALAANGAKVGVIDLKHDVPKPSLDQYEGLATIDAVVAGGGSGVFAMGDIADPDSFADAYRTVADALGPIDILVNNAGIVRAGPLLADVPLSDLDDSLNVNVRGTWIATTHALRDFLAREVPGSIINIVSTAGIRALHTRAAYAVSKAAVAQLTQVAACEYADRGIRVNGICPTYVHTPPTDKFLHDDRFMDWYRQFVPMGRFAEAGEVGNLAVFLASDDARFINWTLIPIDGGELVARI